MKVQTPQLEVFENENEIRKDHVQGVPKKLPTFN